MKKWSLRDAKKLFHYFGEIFIKCYLSFMSPLLLLTPIIIAHLFPNFVHFIYMLYKTFFVLLIYSQFCKHSLEHVWPNRYHYLKKTDFPRRHQLLSSSQLWVGAHVKRVVLAQVLCGQQKKMLWIHKLSGPVIPWNHWFASFLPFAVSCTLLLYSGLWALRGVCVI